MVLGNIHSDRSELGQAEAAYQRLVSILETTLGPEHPLVAAGLTGPGNRYYLKHELEKSERLQRRALAIREQALRPEHLEFAQSLNNLSNVYNKKGD